MPKRHKTTHDCQYTADANHTLNLQIEGLLRRHAKSNIPLIPSLPRWYKRTRPPVQRAPRARKLPQTRRTGQTSPSSTNQSTEHPRRKKQRRNRNKNVHSRSNTLPRPVESMMSAPLRPRKMEKSTRRGTQRGNGRQFIAAHIKATTWLGVLGEATPVPQSGIPDAVTKKKK